MSLLSVIMPRQRDNPALLVLTGAILGLAVSVLNDQGLEWWGFGVFIFTALLFLTERDPEKALLPALYSFIVAAFIALSGWLSQDVLGSYSRLMSFPATLIYCAIFLQISLSFFMAAMEKGGRYNADYRTLHRYAWDRPQIFAASALFVLLVWGLLALWAALFHAVGIPIFKEIFKNEFFIGAGIGAAYAFGVHLVSQHEKIIETTRTIAESIGQALLPLLLLIIAAFLLVLPATGLAPIWDTGHAADIMAALVVFSLAFINAAIRDENETKSRLIRASAKFLTVLLPVVSGIAFYSLYVRIAHYGLTPERIDAAILLIVALCYSTGYAFVIIRRWRGDWANAVRCLNVRLALAVMIVAAIMISPLIDRNAIAAWQQKNALLSGKVDPAEFDFGSLEYNFGNPGKEALEEIRAAAPELPNSKDVVRELIRLDKTDSYYQWQNRNEPDRDMPDETITGAVLEHMVIYPKGAALPAGFDAHYRSLPVGHDSVAGCRDYGQDDDCIAVVTNITGNALPEVLIIGQNRQIFFTRDAQGHWSEMPGILGTGGYIPQDEIRRKLEANAPTAIVPDYRILRIGDIDIIPLPKNKD